MIEATTIDEVINHLDNVIDWSEQKQSRIGYFACLYRKMTVAVKEGISANAFEDGKRMAELDVVFANRYLHAWEAYINKQKCTNAWCAAFDAAISNKLIVLQHLVLGINTHINLDLGIAAAEVFPSEKINELEEDFNKINNVISSLTDRIQDDLSEVWPPLKFLTKVANNHHEAVLNFSISTARKASWINAVSLAALSVNAKENYINQMDNTVVILAKRISNPGLLVSLMLRPVLQMENKNVREVIKLLYN